MGGIEQRKEERRDMRHMNIIDNLVRDVRYAVRTLTRNPGVCRQNFVSQEIQAINACAGTGLYAINPVP
jgi:hypothetical protein